MKTNRIKFVSKKTKSRLDFTEKKKKNVLRIKEIKEEYSKLSLEELIELSKTIMINLEKKNEFDDQLKYEAIISIIDDHPENIYKYKYSTIQYPDYKDPDFLKKIYYKKEFYINKEQKLKTMTKNQEESLKQNLCARNKSGIKDFNLSKNQKFLKTFLSTNSPYNGLLLFHGTGVGKTCASISVAELYHEQLKQLDKKIIILLNPSIQANFMKNIFDIQKYKKGESSYQCTGNKYIENIPNIEELTNEQIEARVKKIIKNGMNFLDIKHLRTRLN